MGGLEVSVHPLFYLCGFYYAFTGRIFVFAVYTVVAVMHELGHSFVAAQKGYRLDRLSLMPFGAVVSGDSDGMGEKDEILIALAGPLLNLCVGLLFVACWWIIPESYAFTDIAVEANLTMAAMNFLPVYPLDGGRVLKAALKGKFGIKKATTICKITGAVFTGGVFALFILSLFSTPNFSVLFFALFLLFACFDKNRKNRYIRFYASATQNKLRRGMPYKKTAVDKSVTVKRLISILDADAINEVAVFDGGEQVAVISQKKLTEIVSGGNLDAAIGKYVGKGKT